MAVEITFFTARRLLEISILLPTTAYFSSATSVQRPALVLPSKSENHCSVQTNAHSNSYEIKHRCAFIVKSEQPSDRARAAFFLWPTHYSVL